MPQKTIDYRAAGLIENAEVLGSRVPVVQDADRVDVDQRNRQLPARARPIPRRVRLRSAEQQRGEIFILAREQDDPERPLSSASPIDMIPIPSHAVDRS